MNNTFSISQALGFGWAQFKAHWKFWLIAYLLVFGMASANSNSNNSSSDKNDSSLKNKIVAAINPSSRVESAVLGLSTTAVDNSLPRTAPVPSPMSKFLPWLVLLIPYLLVTVIGILFLFILAAAVKTILQMGFIHLCIDVARGKDLDYKTLLSDVSVKKALRLWLLYTLMLLIIFFGLLLFIIPGIYWACKYMLAPYLLVDKNLGVRAALSQSGQLTKGVKFKIIGFEFISGLIILLGLLVFIVGVVPAIIVTSLADAYVYVTLEQNVFKAPVPVPVI